MLLSLNIIVLLQRPVSMSPVCHNPNIYTHVLESTPSNIQSSTVNLPSKSLPLLLPSHLISVATIYMASSAELVAAMDIIEDFIARHGHRQMTMGIKTKIEHELYGGIMCVLLHFTIRASMQHVKRVAFYSDPQGRVATEREYSRSELESRGDPAYVPEATHQGDELEHTDRALRGEVLARTLY